MKVYLDNGRITCPGIVIMIESIRRQLLHVYLREASLLEASATLLHSAHIRLNDSPVDDLRLEDDWALIEAAHLERRSDGLLGVLKIVAFVSGMACALILMTTAAVAATWLAREPGVSELAKRDVPNVSAGPVDASVIVLVVVTLWLVLSHAIH